MAAMCGRSLFGSAGLLALMALVACVGCRTEPETPSLRVASPPPATTQPQQPPARAQSPPGSVAPTLPPSRGYAGPLPPLPNVPYPPARPLDVTRAVYAFAARNPEVLRYVPCFCGCEHHGHQGNDDCFVSGRDADGKPRWEMHGYV